MNVLALQLWQVSGQVKGTHPASSSGGGSGSSCCTADTQVSSSSQMISQLQDPARQHTAWVITSATAVDMMAILLDLYKQPLSCWVQVLHSNLVSCRSAVGLDTLRKINKSSSRTPCLFRAGLGKSLLLPGWSMHRAVRVLMLCQMTNMTLESGRMYPAVAVSNYRWQLPPQQ